MDAIRGAGLPEVDRQACLDISERPSARLLRGKSCASADATGFAAVAIEPPVPSS